MGRYGRYLSYWLFFIAPFFEGDDVYIFGGVAGLIRHGASSYLYRYDYQPLYYLLLDMVVIRGSKNDRRP